MPGVGDCGPTEIILAKGGAPNAVTVTMFMQLDGWDPDDNGTPTLGGYQGAFDATTYQGGLAADVAYVGHPGNPGTPVGCNIEPYDQSGLNICSQQVFMSLKICTTNLADPVANADWLSDCTAGAGVCGPFPNGCIDRPDFVYNGMGYTPTVSCAGADYTMGAASTDCRDDDDEFPYFYGGTIVFEVPECAKGTYNVDFVNNVNFTLFNDCGGVLIPGLSQTAGQITIETGSCCFGIGTPTAGCIDNLRADQCALQPAPREFRPGVDCTVECCACVTDFDCNDNNACTDDWCTDCVCNHADNYMVGIECCNPATGDTVIIDDGNLCTDDICDSGTGIVTNPPNTDPSMMTMAARSTTRATAVSALVRTSMTSRAPTTATASSPKAPGLASMASASACSRPRW
jgi:hypothetical protein